MSQADLAKKLKTHQSIVCAVEKGMKPSRKVAAAIQRVTKIEVGAWQ